MTYLMLADGFEEIEALATVDILRRGNVEIKTVSVMDSDTVCGAHNICVKADIMLNDVQNNFDMLILPGGMPGTLNLQKNERLNELILEKYKSGKYLAAICAAPMIFGELKLLEGKKATCYPSFEKHLINADVSEDGVCFDGNIITSRGAGTAHLFAFKLLEILKGKDISEQIKGSMLYE